MGQDWCYMKFISKNELKINQTLFNLINEEVLPGTDIKQDDFWNKSSSNSEKNAKLSESDALKLNEIEKIMI